MDRMGPRGYDIGDLWRGGRCYDLSEGNPAARLYDAAFADLVRLNG
jgi:hypothetical protein